MEVWLRYPRRSSLEQGPYRTAIRLAPNLAREPVSFDAELRDPLRFREAISALHEVVVGDLRFARRSKDAYEAWKARRDEEERELTQRLADASRRALLGERLGAALPPDLDAAFRAKRERYWSARDALGRQLRRDDPALFRALVPCDPLVTVADDAVLFEAFSKDESSYGCLYVDRGSFVGAQEASLGTTNVDYSVALYERFQALRTYRTTRLSLDPSGLDLKVAGRAGLREEKIDVPVSWLRGFGQISALSDFASHPVELEASTLYSILVFLSRHREKSGPRALVFELRRGKPVTIVIEPWGQRIEVRGRLYDGPRDEDVKVWGRRRLFALARLLPMIERIDVRLLGTGLPSVWIAKMGELRLVLALSGWTTNDWSSGVNLDLLAGTFSPKEATLRAAWEHLKAVRTASLAAIASHLGEDEREVAGALHALAREGQIVHDPTLDVYRFRQVLDSKEARRVARDEPLELAKGKELFLGARVQLETNEEVPERRRFLVAKIAGERAEAIIDADGALRRARCSCHHFYARGLRAGPCRHLLALRLTVFGGQELRLRRGSFGGGFVH